RPARALSEGSHLALLAVRVHDPAAARVADDPDRAGGLAGPAASRAHRAGTASAGRCIGRGPPHTLFSPPPATPSRMFAVLLATVLCVATPIKIWNNARIEHRLQEQEKLLLAA